MKIVKKLKNYKLYKTKFFFKEYKLILISHTLDLNSKSWLKTEQFLKTVDLKCYKIKNTLVKKIFNKSIFLNISEVFNGSMCLILPKNRKSLNNKAFKLIKKNQNMSLLAVKLNKNFYYHSQLNKIPTINYKKNVTVLNNTLQSILKNSYYKLSNSK